MNTSAPLTAPEPRWAVCVAADEGFAFPLLMTLRSLARSTKQGTIIYVLDGGLSERSRELARTVVPAARWRIEFVPVSSSQLHGLALGMDLPKGLNEMALARLLAPDLLPRDLQRLIYMDADVLVTGDIGPLATCALDGRVLGAVADPGVTSEHLAKLAAGEVDLGGRYFNSGVLLIDLERWREGGHSARLLTWLERVKNRFVFADQDLLNLEFADAWQPLDPVWNVQTRAFHPKRATWRMRAVAGVSTRDLWRGRRIVHFNAPGRPWANGRHPAAPSYLWAWLSGPLRSMAAPGGRRVWSCLLSSVTLRNLRDVIVCRRRPG